jgi:tRNA-uridine 2-sulfurtransferase
MMSQVPTVVVAMSGGVDSSVAAALLVERGYRVIGMMLRLWSEPGTEDSNRCCTPDAMALARRVSAGLEIPFYAVDVQERFREVIVQSFIDGYAQGITPNPCIACNRHIRWGFLRERALAFGADFFATGHYARLEANDPGGAGGEPIRLMRGRDHTKDQSYVLSVLNQEDLRQTLLPVGEFTKPEVRDLARKFNLPVASRPDSQDLCFLANSDYRDFLRRNAPEVAQPGTIVNTAGQPLGEHEGLAYYTIGQRKGLGIASPEPLYVIKKDSASNLLVVGPQYELGQRELTAENVNWIAGQPPEQPIRLLTKIRYKANEAWAVVTPQPGNTAHVLFDQPLRDITPGQRVVFYQDEECLGGGTIGQSA